MFVIISTRCLGAGSAGQVPLALDWIAPAACSFLLYHLPVLSTLSSHSISDATPLTPPTLPGSKALSSSLFSDTYPPSPGPSTTNSHYTTTAACPRELSSSPSFFQALFLLPIPPPQTTTPVHITQITPWIDHKYPYHQLPMSSGCWCVQIIPQIWHNWRRKSTEGLPGSMLILWSICGVPFGVYAIVQNFNFALKFQPQAFAGLTLISWGQTLYYHNKWRAWTATVATIALAASFGLMEMILILTLRGPYSRGVEWPMMLMAISATVIQILGLIPPYFELAKRNGRVIGIDFWFLTIDYMGAFFSLMAIVAQQWFDALGASLYIVCMLLETGIFASQAIWMWRVRHVRAEAKKAGMTYDEYIAENPSKKLFASESSETFVDVEAGHDEKRTASTCTEKSTTSQTEHSVITPGDAIPTPSEPSPEALPTPPPAVLRPSGPGP